VLAMVINIEGFIKYSAIHEGNYQYNADITNLRAKLSVGISAAKLIVVMDAGIATKKNLDTLMQRGYKYVVVSRVKIKDYTRVKQGKETYLLTKTEKIIRLQAVQTEKYIDSFLKVESEAKGLK
jgi:hypothetical protein